MAKNYGRYMDDPNYLINQFKMWLDNYLIAYSHKDFNEMKRSLVFINSNLENLNRLANE